MDSDLYRQIAIDVHTHQDVEGEEIGFPAGKMMSFSRSQIGRLATICV